MRPRGWWGGPEPHSVGWASLLVLAVAGVLTVEPGAAAAQEPAADTVERVDSARIRVLNRLRALGKGPGLDSAATHLDSLQARRQGRSGSGTGGVSATDSTSRALLEMSGYAPTSYSGQSARFEAAERRLFLYGTPDARPRVTRQGMALAADSAIVYDERTGRVRAQGNASYESGQGDPVDSETLVLDIDSERGSAVGARTRYNQGGTEWLVRGDLPAVMPRIVYGSKTSFTSCTLEEPHYHFESDEIKIHQETVLVARPVRLYFADVPVAWLPFIAQSLGSGRASGLLTPRFSVNDIVRTSRGYSRRVSNVGFYWAMSEYSDASVALDWFSERFTAVNGTLRYRWRRRFLNGGLNIKRFWREEGSTELAFDTRHQWEISERTSFRMSARFTSSTDFVRENSFDPREVTQTIDSQGGLNHRFDWGSLNMSANRKQFLSDDRVEMTLPQASLSLSPITLFQAPASQASFYNNVTWNGSLSFSRRMTDHPDQPADTAFDESRVDRLSRSASASSSVTLGNLSLSQSLRFSADTKQGLPDFLLSPTDGSGGSMASMAARDAAGLALRQEEATLSDLTEESVSWSASFNYQQRLIGSTTITPSLSFQGRSVRNDTLSLASGFVSAPTRMSFGARLKTDIYGFYPGFGSFEQIRHKMSPSFRFDYSPEVTPSQLQRDVFGSREIQTRKVMEFGINQTWEAKLEEEAGREAERQDSIARADSLAAVADSLAQVGDTASAGLGPGVQVQSQAPPGGGAGRPGAAGREGGLDESGLERLETGVKRTLLALQTSVVTYDFVQADSAGDFLAGFTTTTLQNSIRSDYLRGLSVQLRHDLFEEGDGGGPGGGVPGAGRSFSPHLSSLNLSFSLNSRSGIFQLLGLGGDDDGEAGAQDQVQAQTGDPDDPFDSPGSDESSIVPTSSSGRSGGRRSGLSGEVGQWNANISYSLQRPRTPGTRESQMLQLNLQFRPTEQWDVSWRTSYDGTAGRFNDHMIRLTRDLHRWRANFDFRQTATGNWSFRFEVSLTDNEDLHFDYEQRSQLGGGTRR